MDVYNLPYAVLGGIIPALFWLWFWRYEDRKHPEPGRIISYVFIAGMAAVFFVLPFENLALNLWGNDTLITLICWAAIEEFFKYGAAYVAVLRSRYMDEPVDGIIYMITVALGFAALENVFFLTQSFDGGGIFNGLLTGNLRFIGATLLHTVSSAAIGVAIGLSFYKHKKIKHHYIYVGMVIAVTLHTLFNFFILKTQNTGLFFVFSGVWFTVIGLILLFEKVKKIKH